MTQQEEDLFVDSFQNLSSDVQALVCIMAVSFKPLSGSDLKYFARYHSMPAIVKKPFLKELEGLCNQINLEKDTISYLPVDKSLFIYADRPEVDRWCSPGFGV